MGARDKKGGVSNTNIPMGNKLQALNSCLLATAWNPVEPDSREAGRPLFLQLYSNL